MFPLATLLLVRSMAATATAPSFTLEEYQEARKSYSSIWGSADWNVVNYGARADDDCRCSAESISLQIDETLDDVDQYESGEVAPSPSAVEAVKTLLNGCATAIPTSVRPTVSAYYGELDVTWEANGKLVRLIFYSDDRPPKVYFHVESEAVLTRGHSEEVSQASFKKRLQWLMQL